MKLHPTEPPREFEVGRGEPVTLKDTGRIELAPNEQVTFTTPQGGEYDVCRKSWGFYATPSMNGRLAVHGLRAALIRAPDGKAYVFLAEAGQEHEMQKYLDIEQLNLITWLDTDDAIDAIERTLAVA